MKIYLAGSVPKGTDEEKEFFNWREQYKQVFDQFLDAEYIFPMSGDMDEADSLLIVGKDGKSIRDSEVVIVNSEERLGAGTSMEMVIAKHFKKPVITVLPKDSYHRRSNMTFRDRYFVEDWVHPFVHTFSDFILEDIAEVEAIKDEVFHDQIKDISIIDQAIEHRIKQYPDLESQKVRPYL